MMLSYQRMMSLILFNALLVVSGVCHALPFNIFPKVTLPTQVVSGQSVTALYTVQNNTGSSRTNNSVKYLPPHVSQVFSDPNYPDLCGPLFNLAARGMTGDSCTLELKITGAVNNNDPDPHHHLFVCFPGGKTCAGTLFPLNVIVTTSPTPPIPTIVNLVAVGGSFVPLILPVAYYSNDGGASWLLSPTFADILSLPPSQLNGTTCSGNTCVAVGISPTAPIGYTSSNKGVTWSLVPSSEFEIPIGQFSGSLAGVSCVGNSCVSVGLSTGGGALPLAYTSSNLGTTWNLVDPFILTPTQTTGRLFGVACDGTSCVAVGQSNGALGFIPLAYTSNDLGISWTLLPPFTLPFAQTSGFLAGVSCLGSNCTIVGSSTGLTELPLAYFSINGGATWTLAPDFTLPVGETDAFLNEVNCSGSVCIAVGATSGVTNLPLVYSSANGGATWSAPLVLTLPAGLSNGELLGVTCLANTCITVGYSFDGFVTLPLAYSSANGGVSWVLSSPFPLQVGQQNAVLSGVGGSSLLMGSSKYGIQKVLKELILIKKPSRVLMR